MLKRLNYNFVISGCLFKGKFNFFTEACFVETTS